MFEQPDADKLAQLKAKFPDQSEVRSAVKGLPLYASVMLLCALLSQETGTAAVDLAVDTKLLDRHDDIPYLASGKARAFPYSAEGGLGRRGRHVREE